MLVSEAIDRTFNSWLFPAGVNRPAYDVLAADIDPIVNTISLEGRISIPRDSILEVGSELILTKSVAGQTVTAHERGYLDTVGASHNLGERVYLDPMFSRKVVFDALSAVIADLYPQGVYRRVLDQTLKFTAANDARDLPAGTLEVLRATVMLETSAAIDYRRLRPERGEYEVLYEFSPPKLKLIRGGYIGAALILVLAKDFTPPVYESDDLTTTCGVPVSLSAHLPMGVAGTILQSRELPRVMIDEVRRLLASQGVQVGSAMNVGQFMLNMFKQKVDSERRRLENQDPSTFELVR